jgi:hypothetical protein
MVNNNYLCTQKDGILSEKTLERRFSSHLKVFSFYLNLKVARIYQFQREHVPCLKLFCPIAATIGLYQWPFT